MKYKTTGEENQGYGKCPFPVAAYQGIQQEKYITRIGVPHPPEPAEAFLREAFFDYSQDCLVKRQEHIPAASEILLKAYRDFFRHTNLLTPLKFLSNIITYFNKSNFHVTVFGPSIRESSNPRSWKRSPRRGRRASLRSVSACKQCSPMQRR